jgi:uncharacterized protein
MLVALERYDLRIPACGSLKEKRHVVKTLTNAIRSTFNVSVAEVDHHDLWQRAALTVACVAREHREVEALLDDAVRYLNGQEYELLSAERQVVAPGD